MIDYKGKGEKRADCPECSHLHPKGQKNTLSINCDLKVYNCFRCGYAGGLPKIKYEAKQVEQKKPSNDIYTYFDKRGISAKVVNDFGIKSEIKTFGDKPKKYIAFNYYIGNDVVNVKYRGKEKEFYQMKGGKQTFYNFNGLFKESIIICEGEIDVLSFAEVGLNAVSVPSASVKLEVINEVKYLFENKKIYIAVDKDEAGQKLEKELINILGIENVYLIDFFDCKDANEFLLEYGKDELLMRIAEAEPYPDKTIKKASDYFDKVLNIAKNGYEKGFKTGWFDFDKRVTFYKKRIAVITGVPGSGKSTFNDELILRLCLKNKLKCIIFSSENGEREIHIERFITQFYNKKISEVSENELLIFNDIIDKHFSFIEIENPSIELIFEKFKQQGKHTKNDILVIDPYNTLEHKRPKDLSLTEYVGAFLNKCLLFARENDVLIFIIAHPRKLTKNKQGYEEPSLYDISDSANWFNKTEYGFVLHRMPDNRTKLIVSKLKNKYMGSCGFVYLDFDKNTETFNTSLNDVEVKYL